MGTTQDYVVAVEEGATIVRIGIARCCRRLHALTSIAGNPPHDGVTSHRMAFRDSWHRALVYFGLAEEHHDDYEDAEPRARGGARGPLPRAPERAPPAPRAAAATSSTTSSPTTSRPAAARPRRCAPSRGSRGRRATATCACTS